MPLQKPCWLLACWLLAADLKLECFWLLTSGWWLMAAGSWTLTAGRKCGLSEKNEVDEILAVGKNASSERLSLKIHQGLPMVSCMSGQSVSFRTCAWGVCYTYGFSFRGSFLEKCCQSIVYARCLWASYRNPCASERVLNNFAFLGD